MREKNMSEKEFERVEEIERVKQVERGERKKFKNPFQ